MLKEYYIVTNGKSYLIHNENGSTLTSDENLCTKWDKEKSAMNLLDSLKRSKKLTVLGSYKIEYMVKSIFIEEIPQHENMQMIDAIEDISNMDNGEKSVKMNYDIDDMLDMLLNIEFKLNTEKKRYENDLIKISKALTDVWHYMESKVEKKKKKMSASDRCKLSMFEADLLDKRREIKDNITKVECAIARLKGKEKELKLEDRVYKPRVLDELFEASKIPKFEEWWYE